MTAPRNRSPKYRDGFDADAIIEVSKAAGMAPSQLTKGQLSLARKLADTRPRGGFSHDALLFGVYLAGRLLNRLTEPDMLDHLAGEPALRKRLRIALDAGGDWAPGVLLAVEVLAPLLNEGD